MRWPRILGWALVLGGLGLVGWFGWQVWGTTYVAQRQQAEAVRELRQAWREGGTPVREKGAPEAGALVRIPALGSSYAVPLVEGTTADDLAAGFGHLEGTAEPGEQGNFAIAAHRITHGEPLREMPELEAGDQVIVETAERVVTYVLDTGGDALELPFTATWVLAPTPVNPDPGGIGPAAEPALLTLTTCADLFHSDQRLVAFGHLVSDVRR